MADERAESPQSLQDDPLAAAIVVVAKEASSEFTFKHPSPFYPDRDELTGMVLLRLASCSQLRDIWNDPDPETGGPIGLLRYARTVAKHTAIDEKRRNEGRAPEILAARLDEPIYDENGEPTGDTLADTISGEFQVTVPFAFEELREHLTPDEFSVLEAVMDGAKLREIASARGESKATTSRIVQSAKRKAARWLSGSPPTLQRIEDGNAVSQSRVFGLRRSPHQRFVRRFLHTLGWGSSTRPDCITNEALENYAKSALNVVPFRDPASEWRPAIKNKPRVRADRECYNDACTHGGAVGPDNLILPSAQATSDPCGDFRSDRKAESCDFRTMHGVTWVQRHEQPVRYLPAITGKVNQFCGDCEKESKRAEQQVQTVPMNSACIFGNESLHNISSGQGKVMDHKKISEILKRIDCPRSTVARLSGVYLSDLSGWLNNRSDLSADKVERISVVVERLEKVVTTFGQLNPSVKVDLADCDNAARLVAHVDSKVDELPLDNVLQELPEPLRIEGAVAAN